MTLAFRPAELADRHFVVSSWTQSFRTEDTAGFIQDEDWFSIMDVQIAKALARPDVRTIVACESSAPDHLHGFITADTVERTPLVYFVYVKRPYRRGGRGRLWEGTGLARQLFGAIGVDPSNPFNYVCSTRFTRRLRRKIPLAVWKPLYGRFPKAARIEGR